MGGGYFYKNKKRARPKDDDTFSRPSVHMPRANFALLKKISEERDIPISKLINYAVDNELDCDPPFNYNIQAPDIPYKEFEYSDAASKILRFMAKHFPLGTGLDMLVLCRRDFGVENKTAVILGYRELMQKEMIEEFYPQEIKFRYAKSYRYARVKRIEEPAKPNRKLSTKGPLSDIES